MVKGGSRWHKYTLLGVNFCFWRSLKKKEADSKRIWGIELNNSGFDPAKWKTIEEGWRLGSRTIKNQEEITSLEGIALLVEAAKNL